MPKNDFNYLKNSELNMLREYIDEGETHTIHDYIKILRDNLIPVIAISLTILIISIVYALTATDIYKASTVLKLSQPQGNILDAPLLPEFGNFGADRFIANEVETMQNITIREQVARDIIDSFKTLGQRDKFSLIFSSKYFSDGKDTIKSLYDLEQTIEKKVNIEQKRGLDFIEISAESPSPFEAALLVNTYAKVYKKFNLLDNRKQVTKVRKFLAIQREEKLRELHDAENKLKVYKLNSGSIELDEQAKSLIGSITDLESKLNASAVEMSISREKLDQYKGELKRKDPSLSKYLENKAAEPYLLKLQDLIAETEAQKDFALASKSSNSRKKGLIKQYNEKLADLKDKLKRKTDEYQVSLMAATPEEIRTLTQQIFAEEVNYNSLKASYNRLKGFITQYEHRLDKLPEKTIDLARLQRERMGLEKLYLLLEEKYQEALINEQSTTGNVLILNQARLPRLPAKPNRKLIILIGLVLGLGFGYGFALVRNYFDKRVKSPEDIENRNIDLLAWIPKVEKFTVNGNKSGPEFIVAQKADSVAGEAFKALRTRIRYTNVGGEEKTILITSSAPGEGKSLVSVNLAGSFAQANKRTIIVDADLRKPRVHSIFNEKRYPGFTDYFVGKASYEEIVRHSDLENLDLITAGTIPPNPSEILDSRGMRSFIKKLEEEYDIIIIDSPPLVTVTDAEILSRMVDETILVVSANQTDIELMEKSVGLLKRGDESTFIGVLLNNFDFKSTYGSYYKYAYSYSRNGDNKKKNKKKMFKS
ncbi:tyrosine-protein kinase etk [bacterium BMS3Abin04]|nr:tyrosine-protein kinase etk [bacterium BMS3Abin04]